MLKSKWLGIALGTVFAAALSVAAATPAAAGHRKCEPEKVAEKYPSIAGKTLRIGADPQTPPYVFRDANNFENVIGFDADFARAVFACAGVEIEFFLGGWSGLLPAVIAGQIDVMWDDLYYTAERAERVDYVIYMQALTGALTQAGNPKNIKGFEDMCGNDVAVGLGTVEEAAMREKSQECTDAGKEPVEIKTYPDVAAGYRLVQNTRTDIMLSDLVLVDNMVAENPETFARAFWILSGFKIGAAVANGNDDVLRAIADGIDAAQEDGTQKALFEKYGMDADLQLPMEVLTD